MKKITSLSFVLLLVLFHCHDTKESTTENQLSPFHRNVGKKIPMEIAHRWIDRHKSGNRPAKAETVGQLVESKVRQILDSETIGVSFHRGLDETGEYHILAVPVKSGRPIWEAENIVDAKSGDLIDVQIAQSWADRYKAENPNGVWSHFFGLNIFLDPFTAIDFADASNDQGVPQLLLLIWRDLDSYNGRTTGSNEPDVFDHSIGCPPSCGTL